jgi:zinc protease
MQRITMKKINVIKCIIWAYGLTSSPLTVAADYLQGKLSNGMKYHLFTTDVETDYLDLHMLINVGGADEQPQEYGSAHMLEHTLFHSSKHFPNGISAELINQGWKMGEQLNAYTGYEQTKFVMTPPRGTKNFDTALLAMQDIISAPGLTNKDWQEEQQIVLAEWRNKQGMRNRLSEARRQMLNRGARQTRSTLIGGEQDILQREASVLRAFHDRWYQPKNIQIAVIGDFTDLKAVVAKLEKYLGSIQGKSVPQRGVNYYEPKLENKWHIVNVADKQSKNNQVSLVFKTPSSAGKDYRSEQSIRSRLIDRSARTMIMERLDALNLSLPKGVDPLFIQRSEIGHHVAGVSLFAGVKAGKQDVGLQALFKFRQQLLNYPISEQELDFYRDDMDAYIKANLDNTDLPEDIQSLTRLALGALKDRPVRATSETVKLYANLMASIDAEDVNQRIRHWMMAKDRTAMFQLEEGQDVNLPTGQQLNALEVKYQKLTVPAPRDIEDIEGGKFNFTVKSGTVVNKKTDQYTDKVQRWTLSNGDKFVWLKNGIAKDDVFFRSVSKVGYLAKDMQGWRSRLASQFVWMSAPEGHSLQTLGTWRRRNGIIFRNVLAADSFQINGESNVKNIEKIFQAYAAYQLTPKIDDEFMAMQVEGIRASLNNQDETGKQVREAEESLRYSSNYLTVPESDKLSNLKKEDMLALWNKITATPTTFYLVADLPAAKMQELVERYLSGITRKAANKQFFKEKLTSGSGQTELSIENTVRTDIDSWKWNKQAWSIEVLQQSRLATRLTKTALKDTMREQSKGVYTVDFNSTINLNNEQLVSHLHFNAKPESAEKLWNLSQNVLATFSKQLTQEKLDAEKKHLLKAEYRALKQPKTWLNRLEISYEHYDDGRVLQEMLNMDANLNMADTKNMIEKLWQGNNHRTLWVSPKA